MKHPTPGRHPVNTVFPHLRNKYSLTLANAPHMASCFLASHTEASGDPGSYLTTPLPAPRARLPSGAPTFHGLGPGAWAEQSHGQQQTGPQLCQHLLTGAPTGLQSSGQARI